MNFQFVEEGKWSKDAEHIKLKTFWLCRVNLEKHKQNSRRQNRHSWLRQRQHLIGPIEAPAEPAPPPPQPLKLTKIQLGLKRKSGVQQLNVSPQTRFKVDVNAQENRLSGCAVICDGISVVVVEGGHKSINRYGKVMLKRIIWASAVK
nr:protein rdm16 [Quercus suber]